MSPALLRRALLVALVVMPGCSVFEAPTGYITTRPGYACTGTVPQCAALSMAARDLQSREMTDRICAAGADTPACR